jgi:hypothetical protein
MMEQSKIEIAAFINSLVPSAVAAEEQTIAAVASRETTCVANAAGAEKPMAVAENLPIVAAAAEDLPTATASPIETSCAAIAAGAEVQPAVEAQAASASAARAGFCATAADPTAVEAQTSPSAMCAAGADFSAALPRPTSPAAEDAFGPKADGARLTTPTKDSFRASSESLGTVLHGQKTTASPLNAAKETAPLSRFTRDDGCISSKPSEISPAGREKEALLGKGAPWIAAAPFSPSTPSSKPKRIEDVIAFGGISEKIASPVRSSQRVKMQHNGDATQMERATQLAERCFHAISPGTKSNLSFSKFSDFEIENRATTLGVSLGSNASETKRSIAALKHLEEDRRITYLKNNLNDNLGEETDCSIMCTTNQLCSDLAIEDRDAPVGDFANTILDMPIKMLRRRNKKNVSTVDVSVRRSTRINKKV